MAHDELPQDLGAVKSPIPPSHCRCSVLAMAFRFYVRETRKEQLSRISLDSVDYIAYIPGVARCTWTIINSHCIAHRPEHAHRGPDTQQGQPTWVVGFPDHRDVGGALWLHGASGKASSCSAA
jgi:hypothetical protein